MFVTFLFSNYPMVVAESRAVSSCVSDLCVHSTIHSKHSGLHHHYIIYSIYLTRISKKVQRSYFYFFAFFTTLKNNDNTYNIFVVVICSPLCKGHCVHKKESPLNKYINSHFTERVETAMKSEVWKSLLSEN